MKNYKKIVVGFIVAITILGLLAFYFPVRNIPQPQISSEPENYSASINPVSPTSTPSVSTSSISAPVPEKASFDDMSGFLDLGQENDLIEEIGADSSDSSIDDIFKNLNQ